jgi:hypothetical protein
MPFTLLPAPPDSKSYLHLCRQLCRKLVWCTGDNPSLTTRFQIQFESTFFFLNDLFLYLAIDTVFHPSEIIQNGMEISSKSHV